MKFKFIILLKMNKKYENIYNYKYLLTNSQS